MSYYPDTYKEYKVSFNEEFAKVGNLILDYLIENSLLIHPDEKYNAIHVANLEYKPHLNRLRSTDFDIVIEDNIRDLLLNSVITELNSEDRPSRIKFEIIDPVPEFNNLHKQNTRFTHLRKKMTKSELNYDLAHSSTVWHVDNVAYNNMVSITFLDDVTELGGGTTVSSEGFIATYKEDGTLNEEYTFRNINSPDEIKGKLVTGPAGTIVTFNSHLFHSGGIPADKRRVAMLIDFHSSNPNHFHPGPTKQSYL